MADVRAALALLPRGAITGIGSLPHTQMELALQMALGSSAMSNTAAMSMSPAIPIIFNAVSTSDLKNPIPTPPPRIEEHFPCHARDAEVASNAATPCVDRPTPR